MGAQAEEVCKVMKAVLKVCVSFGTYCRVVLSTLYILDLPGGENFRNIYRNSLEMVLLALSFLWFFYSLSD